jgi:hypothetical protein
VDGRAGYRPYPSTRKGLLADVRSSGHGAGDLAKDGADAGGDTRHNSAGGDSHEPCHQGILNKVLTACIRPDSQFPHEIVNPSHLFSSSLQLMYMSVADMNLSPAISSINQNKSLFDP